MSRRTSFLLLLAFVLFALFCRLGSYGLTEPDEGRTAGKAFEFYQSKTWLEPRLYGLGHFNKPPLVYWAGACCFYVGGVNEWTARLPAALAALGTLLLTRALARRLLGEQEALAATLILLTAPLFFVLGRLIDPNMLLTFCITLAFWAAVAWWQDGRTHHRWLFHAALAAGFLTKGPVAVLVVLLGLLGYRLWPATQPRPWRSLWHGPAALACAVASLAWFVAVAQRHPELYQLFLGRELLGRVATDVHERREPFLFYFALFPIGFLPWLPTLVVGLRQAWQRRDAADRLALAWIALPFLLFTLVKSKMPTYILPLYPAAALLMARALVNGWAHAGFRRWQTAFLLLVACAVPAGLAWHGRQYYGWSTTWLPQDALWLIPVAAGVLALGRGRWPAGAAVLLGSYLCTVGLFARHDDAIAAKSSCRAAAAALRPQLQPADRVILFRNYPRGLHFYLQRPITVSDKFELQLATDRERMGDLLYDDNRDVGQVYAWFDREPRVFVVTSDRKRGGTAGVAMSPLAFLKANCRRPVREVHRDGKYVVVCNFPAP